MDISLLENGNPRARRIVVLAHGAGAPMDSDFMNVMAEGLAADGVRVVRFEFPYMRRRRDEGKRGGPDRAPVLEETWRQVCAQLGGAERLVIGGKSMGGRIASMVADELGARGLVCLGYPFHPPGRPEKTRTTHLVGLDTPALFVQGTRDTLGSREDVKGYRLSRKIRMAWLEDGDHSFKPRKKSGFTPEEHLDTAVSEVLAFLKTL